MTDSFPRQAARTAGFTLGAPRSFRLAPDGQTVIFLRSRGGTDPVTCLWALDVATGAERLIADPAQLGMAGAEDDAVEKARRERVREHAGGIVAYSTDAACSKAAFTLAGRVYLADITAPANQSDQADRAAGRPDAGTVRELPTSTPAADPHPDPSGRLVAYVSAGVLRVHDTATGEDRAVADPQGAEGISYGLAEFIAAEEMDRSRGYWWAPDGSAILTARVDETPVHVWHIADPANPATEPRAVRYPAAGTPNAIVSAHIASLDGGLTTINWDREAFPYLVTATWDQPADDKGRERGSSGQPLLVVLSRSQREMRILAVDQATGATSLVRADTDPSWLDIVPGVPSTTAGGTLVWTTDAGGAKRLITGSPAEHAAGAAQIRTPESLNVRAVLGVDGEEILFSACGEDPASICLWTAGPGGLARVSAADGVYDGQLASGTLLLAGRTLDSHGATVRVLRAGTADAAVSNSAVSNSAGDQKIWAEVAVIASLAETPDLPVPKPTLTWSAGPHRVRTAIVLPSWHEPGSGKLPVLCDPYGGPHGKRVLTARGAYLGSQWFAEQGFAVVIADGRGTPGRGPAWDRAVAGDLAGPVLDDQVEALESAAEQCPDLDLRRVGIRGWSFGGYLAALAVLRRPDVFHAAVAGAPPTDWRLYDTCYTERYLGLPDEQPEVYARSSLLADAPKLTRPLLLIHGLADDNVAVAHTLRLSSALLAAGRPHSVLPLSGVTHMASQEEVAENLLLLQVDFLRTALGLQPAGISVP